MSGASKSTLITVLLCAHAWAQNPEPYRLSVPLDGALLGGGLALFIGGRIAQANVGPPACFPCDPNDLNSLDRRTLGYRSDRARIASDLLRDSVAVLAVGGDLLDVALVRGRLRPSEAAADLLVLSEVFLINDGVTALVKTAVRRPRPDAYRPDRDPGAGEDSRDAQAFYSGHASTAFSLGTAATVTFWRRHPRGPARWIVAGAYFALASATAALRVAAGQHFPTDVMVGAAAGTAVGAAVPLLHEAGAHAGPGTIAWNF